MAMLEPQDVERVTDEFHAFLYKDVKAGMFNSKLYTIMKQKIIILAVGLFTVLASHSQTLIDGIYYEIGSDGAHVDRNSECSGKIVIPEYINYNGETIPVTQISSNAFSRNKNITSIYLPKSITKIGYSAFNDCSSLEILSLKSIPKLTSGVCNRCYSLTTLEIDGGNITYNYPKTLIGTSGIPPITNIVIGSGVGEIGSEAFNFLLNENNPTFKKVTLRCKELLANTTASKSLNRIFGNGVEEFVIDEGIEDIGEGAFYGSTSSSVTDLSFDGYAGYALIQTKRITLPSTLKHIGNWAFWHCNSLEGMAIPASVESIGEHALDGCCSLKQIEVEAGNNYYDTREGCNALIESTSNKLIRACANSVIPKTITTIGSYAFDWCQGLENLYLPEHITELGEGAFYGCLDLKDIYVYHKNPEDYNCQAGSHGLSEMFFLVPVDNVTLHVPAGSKEAYSNTYPWSIFTNIVEDATAIKNIIKADGAKTHDAYNLKGQCFTKPQRGVNIIRFNDGTTKKVLLK